MPVNSITGKGIDIFGCWHWNYDVHADELLERVRDSRPLVDKQICDLRGWRCICTSGNSKLREGPALPWRRSKRLSAADIGERSRCYGPIGY